MKKLLLPFFVVFMLISAVACQQAAKKETGQDAMKKAETTITTPQADSTGNAAVDAVGKDLSSTDSVEKDLGTDDLGSLDSGLSDVQNI